MVLIFKVRYSWAFKASREFDHRFWWKSALSIGPWSPISDTVSSPFICTDILAMRCSLTCPGMLLFCFNYYWVIAFTAMHLLQAWIQVVIKLFFFLVDLLRFYFLYSIGTLALWGVLFFKCQATIINVHDSDMQLIMVWEMLLKLLVFITISKFCKEDPLLSFIDNCNLCYTKQMYSHDWSTFQIMELNNWIYF